MKRTGIVSINGYQILNSHTHWTTEYVICLDNGSHGCGSSPRGETTSVYEDKPLSVDPRKIIRRITEDGWLNRTITQEEFDRYLAAHALEFGRNNCYALSVAFGDANKHDRKSADSVQDQEETDFNTRICLNILNGGRYAYTNPVRSDFSEYLLVPRHGNFHRALSDHEEIQKSVKTGLFSMKRTIVNGNHVHEMGGNRGCIEFLLAILEELKMRDSYDIMIDASAGDLRKSGIYHLQLTGEGSYGTAEFVQMWKEIIRDYGIGFLEDPFAEDDFAAWMTLTEDRKGCHIIGDNLYASDAGRIIRGSRENWTTGVIVKPDQSGSVSAVREAIRACESGRQLMISSHRSISTESMFLVDLTLEYRIPYIKVGPLMTDYSAVMRINEFLRLNGGR